MWLPPWRRCRRAPRSRCWRRSGGTLGPGCTRIARSPELFAKHSHHGVSQTHRPRHVQLGPPLGVAPREMVSTTLLRKVSMRSLFLSLERQGRGRGHGSRPGPGSEAGVWCTPHCRSSVRTSRQPAGFGGTRRCTTGRRCSAFCRPQRAHALAAFQRQADRYLRGRFPGRARSGPPSRRSAQGAPRASDKMPSRSRSLPRRALFEGARLHGHICCIAARMSAVDCRGHTLLRGGIFPRL